MSDVVAIDIRVNDEASKELAAIKAQLAALTKQQDDSNKATDEGAKTNVSFSAALGLVKAGALGVAVNLASMAAQIGAVVTVADRLLTAFREQDAVNRDLQTSLAGAGLEGDALRERFAELEATAARVSEATGIGDEEILSGLARFTQVTGDAAASQKDLSIILGIAAKEKMGAREAANIYGRALKGEIGPLKDITSLTKEQEAELNKMTDTEERAAYVTQLLGDQFAGLAENVSPTFLAIDNLSNAKGDLIQKMGEFIEESGLVPIVLDPITKAMRWMESAIEDNQEDLTQWLYGTVLNGIDNLIAFTKMIDENRKTIAELVVAGQIMAKGFVILIDTVDFVYEALKTLAALMGEQLLGAFADFTGMAGDLAETLDLSIAPSLQKVAAGARGLADTAGGIARDGIEGMGNAARSMVEGFDGSVELLGTVGEKAEMIGEGARFATKELKNARDAVVDLSKTTKEQRDQDIILPGGKPRKPKNPAADAKTLADAQRVIDAEAKRLEQIKAQQEAAAERQRLAAGELGVLNATSEEERIRLQYVYDIQRAREQGLIGAEMELAVRQAEVKRLEAIKDLEEERAEKAKEDLEEMLASQRAFSDTVMANIESMAKQGEAISSLIGLTTELAAIQQQYSASVIDGGQATQAALSASGQAAVTFAAAIGASAQVQAGILAVFETANAVAAFASQQYGKGAQHLAAAALYGVAAAKPNPEGKASRGGGGGGGSAARASASTPTRSQQQRSTADDLREVLTDVFGTGQQINITYDFRGSTNLSDNPAKVRELATMVEGDQRSRGIDLDRVRNGRRGG